MNFLLEIIFNAIKTKCDYDDALVYYVMGRTNKLLDNYLNIGLTGSAWKERLQAFVINIKEDSDFNIEGDGSRYFFKLAFNELKEAVKNKQIHGYYPIEGIINYHQLREQGNCSESSYTAFW